MSTAGAGSSRPSWVCTTYGILAYVRSGRSARRWHELLENELKRGLRELSEEALGLTPAVDRRCVRRLLRPWATTPRAGSFGFLVWFRFRRATASSRGIHVHADMQASRSDSTLLRVADADSKPDSPNPLRRRVPLGELRSSRLDWRAILVVPRLSRL